MRLHGSKVTLQYRAAKEQTVSGLLAALKQCCTMRDLEEGKRLHSYAFETGCHADRYVATALMKMYSKCDSMLDARAVFDKITHRDVVSWTTLIMGYVENGESLAAAKTFMEMDCEPDSITFVAALKACASLASEKQLDKQFSIERGMALHRQARERGFDRDLLVASTLIDMYCKCGCMHHARAVFDSMVHWDVVSWNSLLLGYVENGESSIAMDLFGNMVCEPDPVTYVAVLKACACLFDEHALDRQLYLEKGRALHEQARERGFDTDVLVANTLLGLYIKLGSMTHARAVFEKMNHWDVVWWNNLILGYIETGKNLKAMELFINMECEPNAITFFAALKASINLIVEERFPVENGVAIHRKAIKRGFEGDVYVSTTLVEMYSKCRSVCHAQVIFDNMVQRDAVSWTGLILGYVENGESSSAIDLYMKMECIPDSTTFLAVLKACGNLAALGVGRGIHTEVCRLGVEKSHVIATALVDFYGKCGNMFTAEQVFNNMCLRDIVAWSALLAGYSSLGDITQVFSLVQGMQEDGIQMNGIIYLHILKACSHAGMVNEGIKYFECMCEHGIKPSMEHYTCMVDILGRANRVQEALAIVKRMPFEVDTVMWKALLPPALRGSWPLA